jgi:hypothetical protein
MNGAGVGSVSSSGAGRAGVGCGAGIVLYNMAKCSVVSDERC